MEVYVKAVPPNSKQVCFDSNVIMITFKLQECVEHNINAYDYERSAVINNTLYNNNVHNWSNTRDIVSRKNPKSIAKLRELAKI